MADPSGPPARPPQAYTPPSPDSDEKDYYYSSRRLSPSSAARSSGTVDTLDIEKQAFEQAMYTSHNPTSPRVHTIKQSYQEEDPMERESELQIEANSVRLLLFFTFALPLFSLLLALWAFLIVLALTLLHPIRLIITRKRSLSEVISTHLAPVLNMHLEFIYASSLLPEDLRVFHTIIALLGAAPLSFGIAAWAAVLGVYWCFAAIIGNPDGLDGRCEAREMLLTTRRKWNAWLEMGQRE